MTIFVALLRGINVSGHNKLKMADLKAALTASGSEETPESLRQRIQEFDPPA